MSVITNIIRWFGRKLGVVKAHKDYFSAQKNTCCYWQKNAILVYIGEEKYSDIKEAVMEWSPVLHECGITLEVIPHGYPKNADIVVEVGNAVATGGTTHHNYSKTDPREVIWAKVVIAKSEKGNSLHRVVLHELFHALCLSENHEGADTEDIGHSPIYANSLSGADKETLRRIYANRPTRK